MKWFFNHCLDVQIRVKDTWLFIRNLFTKFNSLPLCCFWEFYFPLFYFTMLKTTSILRSWEDSFKLLFFFFLWCPRSPRVVVRRPRDDAVQVSVSLVRECVWDPEGNTTRAGGARADWGHSVVPRNHHPAPNIQQYAGDHMVLGRLTGLAMCKTYILPSILSPWSHPPNDTFW